MSQPGEEQTAERSVETNASPACPVPGDRPEHLLDLMLDSALDMLRRGKTRVRGSIMLLDEQAQHLEMGSMRGIREEFRPTGPLPLSGPAATAIREKRVLHTDHPIHDNRGIRESLVLPLESEGRIQGSLNLSRESGRAWKNSERERVIQFARQTAWMIEEFRRQQNRERRLLELDRTLAFTRIFASTRELSKILELLINCGQEVLAARRAFVTVFDHGGGQYASYAAHHLPEDTLERLIRGLKAGFGHPFFEGTGHLYLGDLTQLEDDHPLAMLKREELGRSLVVIPLVFGYRVLGRLYLIDPQKERMHAESLRVLDLLGQEAAIAIDQGRTFFELRDMAFTDSLTRVTNRNYWMQRFEEESIRSRRQEKALSLLMVDIDHFKVYNDTFGHQVGDRVLKMVAGVIQSCLREMDVVGRYGGEEFGILLPDTEEEGANYVAERIRQRVSELDLGRRGEPENRLTVSVGCYTSHGSRPESAEQILRAADTALLYSKSRGRNRVSLYTPVGIRPGDPAPELPPPGRDDDESLESSSRFLFRMADSLGARARGQSPQAMPVGFHVMIAGGESGEHRHLEELFQRLGYEVRLIPDCAEAVESLCDNPVDLVILDLCHKEADRGLLLRGLKEKDPYLPVIVLTGSEGIEQAVEAIRVGADDYLLKPFGVDEIRQSVEKAFSRRMRILQVRQDGSPVESRLEVERAELPEGLPRAPRDLRLLQEFNRRTLKDVLSGVLLLDAGLHVLHTNRRAIELLSCENFQQGQELSEFSPEIAQPEVLDLLRNVLRDGGEQALDEIKLPLVGRSPSGVFTLRAQRSRLEDEDFLLLRIESLVDTQLLQEEARRLKMSVARQIFGQVAQHLQLITGRSELIDQKSRSTRLRQDLRQIRHSAEEISRILTDLGNGLDENGATSEEGLDS